MLSTAKIILRLFLVVSVAVRAIASTPDKKKVNLRGLLLPACPAKQPRTGDQCLGMEGLSCGYEGIWMPAKKKRNGSCAGPYKCESLTICDCDVMDADYSMWACRSMSMAAECDAGTGKAFAPCEP